MEKNREKRLRPEEPSKKSWQRRLLWRAARLILLFIMLSIGLGLLLKERLVFQPSQDSLYRPEGFGLKSYEEVWLGGPAGGGLKALIIADNPADPGPSFLVFSGNSGNISLLLDRMSFLHSLGLSVMAVDYPGFGESAGKPSEEGLYQAAEALWALAAERGVKAEESIIYGFSLGGAVAAYLAQAHPPGALILDSTFTRLRDVPSSDLPLMSPLFALVLGNAFDSRSRLKDIHCPLLVLHTPNDEVVPFKLGRELYETYENNRKALLEGTGGHMDFLLNTRLYGAGIKEMADSVIPPAEPEEREGAGDADQAG